MKLFGLFFISLVPILFGLWQKRQLLRQGRIKEALIRFFQHLSFEIEAFLRPQEEIFATFQNEDLEEILLLPLRLEVKKDPCFALERVMEPFLDTLPFTPRESLALKEFSKNFGIQSKERQIEDCKNILAVLKSEEERLKDKRLADGQIAQTVGICAGVGIFILLL
jgi:stage III sporulation protein AB